MGTYQETMVQEEGTNYCILDIPLLTHYYYMYWYLLGSHRINFKDPSQKQKRD